MLDFDILAECGTTQERLRQIFTATGPAEGEVKPLHTAGETPEQAAAVDAALAVYEGKLKDVEVRKAFEAIFTSRINEAMVHSLKDNDLYRAVDLAWDAQPINKATIPLMLFAQGRIDLNAALESMGKLSNGQQYIRKSNDGKPVGINLPKFLEVNINLVRSLITRRMAAQCNKYSNQWPYWGYESRSTSLVGKLRADAFSQQADIMADQYDHRRSQEQTIRDMFLYAHSVDFPRSSWEKETQWRKADIAEEFQSDKPAATAGTPAETPKRGIKKEAYVTKEGIAWVRPHPTRLIWDNRHALAAINADIGPEFIGYWDVARYRDVYNNPQFWNRDKITYSEAALGLWTEYSGYFTQYFNTLAPLPSLANKNTAVTNDRANNVGLYSGEMLDSSVYVTEMFQKVVPNQHNMGSYPYPVWIKFTLAGDCTVIHAEIMPSTPAAVTAFNVNDSRKVNISTAHELMGFQDQMTNLTSQLLQEAKRDLFSVAILNEDIWPSGDAGTAAKAKFIKAMESEEFYSSPNLLTCSFAALKELGVNITADSVFKIVRSGGNNNIDVIFKAMAQLVATAERLMNLSPQEQGQPAKQEITATESTAISATTESVYSFISDAIDAGRAAKKRIIYESWMALGSQNIRVPIINRYPPNVIKQAGFDVVPNEDGEPDQHGNKTVTIIGTKRCLQHDFIFTSRDSGERGSNSMAATALAQVFQYISAPAMLPHIPRDKVYMILNEIFRLSGAGVDLKLELAPGEENTFSAEADPQMQQALQQIGEALRQNTIDIQGLKQLAAQLTGQPPAAPQPAQA